MDDIFEIPIVNRDCNFWMMRTKTGWFYKEFINDKFKIVRLLF